MKSKLKFVFWETLRLNNFVSRSTDLFFKILLWALTLVWANAYFGPYSPLCLSSRTGALTRRYTCVSARSLLLVRRSALARAALAKPLCQLAWRELSDLGVFRLALNLSWLFCVQSSVLSHSSTRSLVHTEQQIIFIKNG